MHSNFPLKMKELNICVLIPTYNNDKTLKKVLDETLLYTDQIIVVNDGSTDQTAEILKNYTEKITVLTLEKNSGKGKALQVGFEQAKQLNFNYAITLDSDGQHFASDIPFFIDCLEKTENQNVILIGSRNLTQKGVPKKSNFGNRFSNFWFWFETGISLNDTQSGFRLYPLKSLKNKYFTNKFEFEIEVIVRAAWDEVAIKNLPIQVWYDKEERVSHFRPFRDFVRISVLNTFLVFLTLVYIAPRNLIQKFKKKSLKDFFKENILGSQDSSLKISLSIALGILIGLSPFWGFHTFLAIFFAVAFRLNKLVCFTFSNISIPPMIPLIVILSLKIGYYFVPFGQKNIILKDYSMQAIAEHFWQYFVGSLILATSTAVIFGSLSYVLISFFKKNK